MAGRVLRAVRSVGVWVRGRSPGRLGLVALSGMLLGAVGSCTLPQIKPPGLP